MSLTDYISAFLKPLRKRATMAILAYRVRARHRTLNAHPTAIWDYGYHDLHAIELGKDVTIGAYSYILVYSRATFSDFPGRLIMGDRSAIGFGANVRAAGGTIRIGAGSAVAQNCVLIAANHAVRPGEPRFHVPWEKSDRNGIEIGSNVWVGASCVILPGAVIGNDAVIGAGSVVRGTVPPGELWAGVPARKIKTIGGERDEEPATSLTVG